MSNKNNVWTVVGVYVRVSQKKEQKKKRLRGKDRINQSPRPFNQEMQKACRRMVSSQQKAKAQTAVEHARHGQETN